MVAIAWRRSGRPSMDSGISPKPMALTVRLPMGRCRMCSSSSGVAARSAWGHRRRSRLLPDHVERNPVEQRVVGDRPGVGGACTQGLAVVLTGPADVGVGDASERDLLHAVDDNLGPADAVDARRP